MLIENETKPGQIVTIKLTSGEEIIAKLEENTANTLKVSRPVVLTMTQNGLGMAPYLFTVDIDTLVRIDKKVLVVLEQTETEAAEQYNKAVDDSRLAEVTKKNKNAAMGVAPKVSPEKV
jgi:hypothetical protein